MNVGRAGMNVGRAEVRMEREVSSYWENIVFSSSLPIPLHHKGALVVLRVLYTAITGMSSSGILFQLLHWDPLYVYSAF